MTIRNAVLGLAVVFGLAVWSWCRPCGGQAHAQGSEVIHAADEPGTAAGGNHDEAAARFRSNQSHHWRQVAIGMRGNCP
jgi:hypothetical protein